MSSSRRTVLIVDDSALMRTVLRDEIGSLPDFDVIGTASDGRQALDAVRTLSPDIVTLDVEMPNMDGLETLERLMRESPRPVVMLSGAETDGGVELTLRALELGAVDFVRKPGATGARSAADIGPRLAAALRAAAATNLRAVSRPSVQLVQARPEQRVADLASARAVIAIAASTGGPRALAEVVASLPGDLDAAVLIAQHMPRGFTRGLAHRLAQLTSLGVAEGRDGERIVAGRIYLAPGGRHMHMATGAAGSGGATIVLDDGPTVWGVRPAADKLFVSVAREFGDASVGVVLTGMGRDGALGLSAIREAGGGALVQDEATSAVYGMPREALETAGADRIVTPAEVGEAATQLLARHKAMVR